MSTCTETENYALLEATGIKERNPKIHVYWFDTSNSLHEVLSEENDSAMSNIHDDVRDDVADTTNDDVCDNVAGTTITQSDIDLRDSIWPRLTALSARRKELASIVNKYEKKKNHLKLIKDPMYKEAKLKFKEKEQEFKHLNDKIKVLGKQQIKLLKVGRYGSVWEGVPDKSENDVVSFRCFLE